MVCNKCGCELRIKSSYALPRDGTVYTAHDMVCANPKCGAFGKLAERTVKPYDAGNGENAGKPV